MDPAPAVRVLLADPADLPALPPPLLALLDDADRAAAARKRQPVHRHEALCSRLVQRLAVAEVAGLAPQALRFAADAQGRPQAQGAAAGVVFSATNCAGLVACAAGRGVALGLDAEPLARALPRELLAGCLSPAERAALEALPPARQAARFFALWTLKEAWFKARGHGIDRAPSALGLAPDLDPPRAAPDSPAAGWWFRMLGGAPDHALALCSDRAVAVSSARVRWDGAGLTLDPLAG